MPHCILECSSNIVEKSDFRPVLQELNQTLAGTGLFKLNDIKSRVIIHDSFLIGDGDEKRGFAALSVGILRGRNEATRQLISRICFEILIRHFQTSLKELKFDISVQINEIDKESYIKTVSPNG